MLYKEYKPNEELLKYVKCFWIMEREYSKDSLLGDTEYLWPTGLTEILYTIGSNFKHITNSSEVKLPNEFVIGAYKNRFILKNSGKVKIIGIRCYNYSAQLLFNIDPNKIKNTITGYNLENINREILESGNDKEIILYLNEYCKNLIKYNDFTNTMYKLYQEDLSIEELANESNLSIRQFERKVKSVTSFTPKELLTIIRFDKARVKMLWTNDYLQVMSDLGYYDYSHFSKDFKKYYEITPKQFTDLYHNRCNK